MQHHGYLPRHGAWPLFDQYQFILLGDRGTCVWTTCLRLLTCYLKAEQQKVKPATLESRIQYPICNTIQPQLASARHQSGAACSFLQSHARSGKDEACGWFSLVGVNASTMLDGQQKWHLTCERMVPIISIGHPLGIWPNTEKHGQLNV